MSTVMAKVLPRVLLDTNILISALVFGGRPFKILSLALERKIQVVTSVILFAELVDVINKKFPLSLADLNLFEKQAKKTFEFVNPKEVINIVSDDDDNRVLEAAFEGECNYIVTGDKELLDLGEFKEIKVVTATDFVKLIS